ncbi:MAG: T9SS type A sorting domain-containing protein [Bacteroidetes bacterium]|jgi:hypothetical protein|nr:T9SS type A sorting domain-containing protein [Bacteroidota bacterium]
MKKVYKIVPLVLFVCMMFTSISVMAQNTLVVPWLSEDGTQVLRNSLFETIQGDTTETGERIEDRVYVLEQGGFYYVTETIQNDGWHLRIEGEPGDPNDEFANPPMIQIAAREDATTPDKMFNIRGDLTISNVIINGRTTLGGLPYEIIDVRSDEGTFTFDNVIFEHAQWGIAGFYSKNANLYFTNNKFRNLISENEPWGGRGMSIWADVDTVWVENNTFHNIGFTTMQVEGASANFVWFNQNTIVNNGRQVMLWAWVKEGYFTNNIVLNPFWQGEDPETEISQDRLNSDDEQYSGMFAINELPAQYGLDAQRRILISNNVFFTENEYNDWFDNTDIRKQPLLNGLTTNLFSENENMVEKDNRFDVADPGFSVYADNHQERMDFITDIRNSADDIRLYYWDPNRDESAESIQWPLPEDLTYSNTELQTAAYGNYPLGDLNWYPSDKSAWEANKEAQYDEILGMLGAEVDVTFLKGVEAEVGTPSGDATKVTMDDRNIVRIEGSGSPTWTFNLDEGGTYDVRVTKRTWYEDGNEGRQTDLIVNEADAVPVLIGEAQDGVTWSEPVVEGVEGFVAGSNTLTLGYSWGFLEYKSVTILDAAGDEVITLYPAKADISSGGSYRCEGSLCASGDEYVEVTGGDLTIPVEIEEEGNYTVKFKYMAIGGGEASADISLNGTLLASESFAGEDSTWTDVSLSDLPMIAGTNNLKIGNIVGSLGLDRIDIFVVSQVSVSNETLTVPEGFELAQNYPNPFNPSTNISFNLPQASNVSLTVYNVIGQRVAVLANGVLQSGTHTYQFDASNLASGMYLYRLETENFSSVRKMMLIK